MFGMLVADKRKFRVRSKLKALNSGKLRLSIVKTNRHIYLQLFDDAAGLTLVHASTNCDLFKTNGRKTWCNVASASRLVDLFCENAIAASFDLLAASIYFDRGGSPYIGIVKAAADSLRMKGLRF